jgi:peptidoglycan/LPS O-acetylase OafA/YrhL
MSAEAATHATDDQGADQGAPPASERPPLLFRRDIQGIRALAVLLVIVNHFAPGLLTGGFIGVDVFFVVSGFLITSLLVKESGRSGRISLVGFYARRARRIIPAATVVIVVTVAVSLWKLPLLRAQDILTDGIWSAFFGANIHMANVGTDYFAQGQPPSPLRHYWSLAVEEQFYLVWPLLLMVCLALLRRRGHEGAELERRFGRTAWVVIGVAIVASLAWSVHATYTSPVTAYYSTFTRAYELGAGAACALLLRPGSAGRVLVSQRGREVLAGAGLVVIAASAVLLSEGTTFPGLWALVPVLGTVALIVAGGAADLGRPTGVARLLSIKPATVIGDWSFSLYLWHWPVIVLGRGILGAEKFNTVPVAGTALVLTAVLSWASFRWIENPFRRGTWRRVRLSLAIYPVSIATVLVTVVAGHYYVQDRLTGGNAPPISIDQYGGEKVLGDDQYVALVKASVIAAQDGAAVPSDLTPGLLNLREQTASLGDCDYRTGTKDLCPSGAVGADRKIVVLGDSYARAVSPAIDKIGEQYGYEVYVLVYSGCQATSLEQIDRSTGRVWQDCQDFKRWAVDTIGDLEPDLTLVASSVGKVVDPDTGGEIGPSDDYDQYLRVLDQGWQGLFRQLTEVSDRVVAVGNTPRLREEAGVCLTKDDPDLGDCASPPGPRSERAAKVLLSAARAVGAESVNAKRWFCADGLCPAVVGNFITMRDTEHMTPDYARWLAAPLAAALELHQS